MAELEQGQEKNSDSGLFSERTTNLAREIGVSLRELAPKMNISTASLFAYRSGKLKISPKAWRKLDQCERELAKRQESPFSGKELCFYRIAYGLEISEFAKEFGLGVEEYSEIERGIRPIPDSAEFWAKIALVASRVHQALKRESQEEELPSDDQKPDPLQLSVETAIACLREGNEETALDLAIALLNEYKGNRKEVLPLFRASAIIRSMGHARLGITPDMLP